MKTYSNLKRILLTFLLLFWFGWHLYEAKESCVVGWDKTNEGTVYYELKAERLAKNTSQVISVYPLGITTNTSFTFQRQVSGHFRVKIRACWDSPCKEDATRSSRWAESTNISDAVVDGQPMGWVIFFKPKQVTGVKVSQLFNLNGDDEI